MSNENKELNFINVWMVPGHHQILYDLLCEREPLVSISHESGHEDWERHKEFVDSDPYREWFMIRLKVYEDWTSMDPEATIHKPKIFHVGSVGLTNNNEVFVAVFKKFQRQGFGSRAVQWIIKQFEPLPAIPSVRAGRFIANINPKNEASIKMFEKLGFTHIQNTYGLRK